MAQHSTGRSPSGCGSRSALVGVIGHVDHGKTALMRALTGVETDRLAEEKRRGLSIVLGFASLRTASCDIDLVDMPGHERFIRAMISGATGMSAVLLVVAATEGVKPQTLEHLEIARLIGVRRGVIAISKCDLVAPERVAEVSASVGDLAREVGLFATCVATSVVLGTGLPELRAELLDLAKDDGARPERGFAYLPIDRAFALPGVGPVVTGTLRGGPVRVGDEMELVPGGRLARVRSLQVHGCGVEEARPGRRTAVALRGVGLADVCRGMALAAPGSLPGSPCLDVALTAARYAGRATRIGHGQRLRMLFGTSDVPVRVRLLSSDGLASGAPAPAQLHCEHPIAVPAREPFVLRCDSPSATLGGGIVLDPAAMRRRRFDKGVLRRLQVLATGDPREIIATELDLAGPGGVPIARLGQLTATRPDRLAPWLAAARARPGPSSVGLVVAERVWQELESHVLATLAAYHAQQPLEPGLRKDALAAGAKPAARSICEAVLGELLQKKALVNEGGFFRIPGCVADAAAASPLRGVTHEVEAAFRRGRLMPPDEAVVTRKAPHREQALRYLVRRGLLVRTRDCVQRRTITFHREAIADARRVLARHFSDGARFTASEVGAALGTTRKFTIPLLEHLDASGFTQRDGAWRVIREPQTPQTADAGQGNGPSVVA